VLMPFTFTLKCMNQCMVTSGVKSLLIVEKMLMKNDLAMHVPSIGFSSGIYKLVDRWDKC